VPRNKITDNSALFSLNEDQLLLTNACDVRITANVLQTNQVDAQHDKLATKLS